MLKAQRYQNSKRLKFIILRVSLVQMFQSHSCMRKLYVNIYFNTSKPYELNNIYLNGILM